MKIRIIKRSILAGALALAVFGSQSIEILMVSAASEEFEYEGTTQISSVDYYPAFDTMSTALTVEEVYVEAGSSVQEGDAILKLTEDSYQSALDYYQAAIIRATNDLTNEELAYAQGMQSAEYELELALASEEQAEFVQKQSEAELSDTIEEHEEVMTEMEERIEALENGEYDTEEEAEEGASSSGLSASGMSGGSASESGMSASGGNSSGDTSGNSRQSNNEPEKTLPQETETEEEKNIEEQITELKEEAESLQTALEEYLHILEDYQEREDGLKKEIEEADRDYDHTFSKILEQVSGIYELLNSNEANLETTEYNPDKSALESAEETYQEPEVTEESQVEAQAAAQAEAEAAAAAAAQAEAEAAAAAQAEADAAEAEAAAAAAQTETEAAAEQTDEEEAEALTEEIDEEESESETEPQWDGMFDPEHPERGGRLIAQIAGGTITMEIPENAFTEAVSLQVSELTASYEALINGSVDAGNASLLAAVLNKAYENREGTWEDTKDQIYDFYVLNLSFVNQEGAIVEPAAAIQVSVDHSVYPVNVEASGADMGRTTEDLYRISPSGGAAEAVGSQIGLNDNRISSLSFSADSFSSPFVVLMIETAGKEEIETESEMEEEELSLINTLNEANEADETNSKTEEGTEDKVTELLGVLDELLDELKGTGENEEVIEELKKYRDQLETEGVSLELLLDMENLFNQINKDYYGEEALEQAIGLVYELENRELKELVNQLEDEIEDLAKHVNQLDGEKDELGNRIEDLEDKIDTLSKIEETRRELYQEYYNVVNDREAAELDLEEIEDHIGRINQQIIDLGGNVDDLVEENENLQKEIEKLTEAESESETDGSAMAGTGLEGAMEESEGAGADLSDETDLSALAGMSGMSGMSGMDASSMANMSDTEAMQLAEEELAAGLGESTISEEGVLEVQNMLSAMESESMFGDQYDLTEAKALLERKATDADEAEELLDELYPMQESVQLDYEELLRLRKPLQLEIQYQYDETLLLARTAEVTYDQTTRELDEELEAALENLSDLEDEFQELEDLGDGTVRAAASGTLSAVYYEAEDTLFALYPMYSIYDTDTVTVLIAVPQSEIAQISVGEEVEVTLSSFGNTQGTVTEKAVEAQEGTSRTTVNYEVEVSIDNSSGRLSSGTAVTVTVTEA